MAAALAGHFGQDVRAAVGLPVRGAEHSTTAFLDAEGRPTWEPVLAELTASPAHGRVVASGWHAIHPLRVAGPALFTAWDGWVLEAVPAGLWLRPEAEPQGAEPRMRPASYARPLLIIGEPGRPLGGEVWDHLDPVLAALPSPLGGGPYGLVLAGTGDGDAEAVGRFLCRRHPVEWLGTEPPAPEGLAQNAAPPSGVQPPVPQGPCRPPLRGLCFPVRRGPWPPTPAVPWPPVLWDLRFLVRRGPWPPVPSGLCPPVRLAQGLRSLTIPWLFVLPGRRPPAPPPGLRVRLPPCLPVPRPRRHPARGPPVPWVLQARRPSRRRPRPCRELRPSQQSRRSRHRAPFHQSPRERHRHQHRHQHRFLRPQSVLLRFRRPRPDRLRARSRDRRPRQGP